jgi:hypothetical protein
VTDSAGNYKFVNLVPGRYHVNVEQSGFKHFRRDQILVEVQAAVRIDAAMQVADLGQVTSAPRRHRYGLRRRRSAGC